MWQLDTRIVAFLIFLLLTFALSLTAIVMFPASLLETVAMTLLISVKVHSVPAVVVTKCFTCINLTFSPIWNIPSDRPNM